MSRFATPCSAYMTSFIAIFFALANPTNSFGDVSESTDNTGEDLAGFSLILTNIAAIGYLGHSMKTARTNQTIGYLGLAFGGGTVALGATETTSFSYGVMAAGAVTMALAVVSLVQSGPDEEDDSGESFDLSDRGPVIAPIVLSDPGDRAKFGLAFSTSF